MGRVTIRRGVLAAPPSEPSDNHEPAGFTPLWYMDGTTKAGLGGMTSDSNVVVVSDAEAPNGSALELRWPLGTSSGFTSQYTPSFAFSPREIYIRMTIKWNPDWDFNPGGDKFSYFGHVGKASSYFPQLRVVGAPNHRIGFQVQTPSGGSPNFWWVNQNPSVISSDSTNVEVFQLTDGQFHVFEWVMRAQSSAAASDGEYHFWIDGVLESTGTNFRFNSSGDVRFGPPEFYPYWGGSSSSKDISPYDWARYAEFYISGTE